MNPDTVRECEEAGAQFRLAKVASSASPRTPQRFERLTFGKIFAAVFFAILAAVLTIIIIVGVVKTRNDYQREQRLYHELMKRPGQL